MIKLTQVKNGINIPIILDIDSAQRLNMEITEVTSKSGRVYHVIEEIKQIERMILRDQFAVSALNGLLSNSGGVVQANSYSGTGYANGSAEYTALWAYELADAMLKERGK